MSGPDAGGWPGRCFPPDLLRGARTHARAARAPGHCRPRPGHHDPAVGKYGLDNGGTAVNGTFFEVVAPNRRDTAVDRFLARQGGRGGYMAIFDCGDLAALRQRNGAPSMRLDLGDGPTEVTATTWGDVYTAWTSTGIPNIEVFMAMPHEARSMVAMPMLVKKFLGSRWGRKLVERRLQAMPAGPSDAARATGQARIFGRATNAVGRSVELRLRTHEAYRLTAESAVEIGARVLNGDAPVGYQTPAMAYGPEFVLALDGSVLIEN